MIRRLATPPGAYNLPKLRTEASAAWPKCIGVNEVDDGTRLCPAFYFEDVDAPQQTAVDALMAAHNPTPLPLDPDLAQLRQYMPVSGSPTAAAVTAYIGDNTNPLALRATMLAIRAIIRLLFREATS